MWWRASSEGLRLHPNMAAAAAAAAAEHGGAGGSGSSRDRFMGKEGNMLTKSLLLFS